MRTILALIVLSSSLLPAQAASRDSAAFKKEKEIALPGANGCDYLSIDAKARRLYLTHGTAVDVVDLTKGEKVGEIGGVAGAHGAIAVPAVKRGFASSGKNDKLVVFDLDTLKTVKEVQTGKNPDAILFVPATNEVWAMNGRTNNVTCVDATSLEVKSTIALDGRPEFAVADAKGKVFVNLEDKNAVAVIDAKEHKVTGSYPLAACDGPTGLAIDAEHGILFSGCSKKLAILDAASGKMISTMDIGNGCDAVAFDPATKNVFASCGDGTTAVIHEDAADKFSSAGTIQTARGAKTCTLDLETHKLWLAVRPGKNDKEGVKLLAFAPTAAK